VPHAGPDLVEQLSGRAERRDPEIPFRVAAPEPVVLAGLPGDAPDAWRVWHDLISSGDHACVTREVLASGLRGRGGAGFPAATKWASVADSGIRGPRYVVCNGDEGDPGSFVDRLLMESDPHRILAGMALAGYAIGAEQGYVYVRSEYPRARDALRRAVTEAREAGHLGADRDGIRFDVEVFEGAGSYVAGEETSLIHSMEGLRGEVARRPPYPTEDGFLHRPTVVNNVETLCAVPWIVERGGEAYAKLGAGGSKGTKVVCLNERFNEPGAYEVELGVGLRYVFEELGGGLRDGNVLRSLQVGGPLGGFIGPDHLDVPLSFDALRSVGADLGHGSLVAIDEHVPAHELFLHMWRFAAGESCGTCAPCRVGTRRGLEAAERLAGGEPPDARTMNTLFETMRRGSLCAFGKSVPGVVWSLIDVYAEELGIEGIA
jgi:NADH:ubiquinone oxidoreductase subunit F (NADH-binding)